MKLGIYGGTFNPPHTGHLTAARSALEALELDRLVLLPAAQPPHKVLPPGAPSAEQRLDMTAIAADALLLPGRVEASALELKRPGVSYTADTLRQLREQEPDAQLWLLMGADMFLSFQNWREPDVIARLAGICAFARTPDAPEQALCAQARRLERELVLADTVGFIRNLPKELVEAFRATLEELESASLLLHVADASHPEFDRQMESVESILADLDLSGIPRLLILNKWDAADADTRAALLAAFPDALPVSALTGAGLDHFSRELEKRLFDGESGIAGSQ